jgi:4-amino-4-deoxy-L-arabinose transferase-like glycosyltransferase
LPESVRAERAWRVALLLVLLGGTGLRLWAVGYGHHFLSIQIDEDRNVSLPLYLIRSRLAPWHPHYAVQYDYPALLWYLLFAVYSVVLRIGRAFHVLGGWGDLRDRWQTDPVPLFLLGRSLSVAFGTATLALLYRVGRTLFSPAHGLLAAAFLACAFLHVRDSALATLDAPVTFFVVWTLFGAAKILKRGRGADYAVAGVAAGLAIATKYTAIVVLVAIILAHVTRDTPSRDPLYRRLASPRLLGSLLLAGLVFGVVNPYLLLNWPRAWEDLRWLTDRVVEGQVVNGQPIPIGSGWRYHLLVSLRYGLGWGLLGLAGAGILRTLWRRDTGWAMLLGFTACFYLGLGGVRLVFVRYMTPLLPVLCLFAASAVLGLAGWVARPRVRAGLIAGLALAAVVEPFHAVTAYSRIVHNADTRVEAFEFLFKMALPPGEELASYGPSVVWRSTIPPGSDWKPTSHPRGLDQTWSEWVVMLEQAGTRYLLVHTSALEAFSPPIPELEQALTRSAILIREFSPYAVGTVAHPVYDRADPYYFPIGRFAGVQRPGPRVRIYRLSPIRSGE